jgi:hypothetical protein
MHSWTSPQPRSITGFSDTQDTLRGSVRNAHLRYGFQLRWDGTTLEGRLGGRFIGEHLRLRGSATELLGIVTGGIGNLAVRAVVSAEKLHLRVITGSGEVSAETALGSGTGVLHDRGSSGAFVIGQRAAQLNLTLSDTESVQLEGAEKAPDWIRLTSVLLAVIVTREINRAQLESLRDMGEL